MLELNTYNYKSFVYTLQWYWYAFPDIKGDKEMIIIL